MKSNSTEIPQRVHDLGDGTSHLNYNIVEVENGYDYSQVTVTNPATYDKIVVALMRLKYSGNDELAVLRQQFTKPDEFTVYNDYAELCKVIAKD